MKIQDTKNFELVAKCIKNTSKSMPLIRFDDSVCEKRELLSKEGGRVYLICVNDEIYKIGCSKDKNGMKGTLNSYQGAMAEKSGINRYGIHVSTYKKLKNGKNKVDVYVRYSPQKSIDIIGLNTKYNITVSPAKEFEDICKKDYHDKEGTYPKWNVKENNETWPDYIHQRSHYRKRKKQIDKRP